MTLGIGVGVGEGELISRARDWLERTVRGRALGLEAPRLRPQRSGPERRPGGRRAAAGEVGGHPEPYDSGRSPAPPRLLRGTAREGSFRAETPLPPPTGRRWGGGALERTATCLTSCGHSLRARGSCCETPSRSRGALGLWPLLMGDALVVREALGPRTHSSPSPPSGRGDPDGVPSL